MKRERKSSWHADGTRLLLGMVCVCSFLSRYSFDVAGVSIRPEHVATGVLVAWYLVDRTRRRRLWRAVQDPLVAIFVLLLCSGIGATIAFAPSFTDSLPIIGWLAMDVVLLACLLSTGKELRVLERVGSTIVLPWAAGGIALAVGANHFGWDWGTQYDPVYDVSSPYVTAYESNIFAATVTTWALILVARHGSRRRLMLVAALVIPSAILVSQTRAAVVGLAAGLLLLLLLNSRRSTLRHAGTSAGRFGPALVLGCLIVLFAMVTLWPDFGSAVFQATPGSPSSASSGGRELNVSTAPGLDFAGAGVQPARLEGRDGPTTRPGSTPDEEETKPAPGASPVPEDGVKLGEFSGDSNNVRYRRLVAELALKDVRGIRILTGNGINTFGQRHEDPTLPGVPGYLGSLPLQILYDTGIIGLALLTIFVVLLLRRLRPSHRSVAYAVLLAFAITSTLTSTFWFATTWIMVAILVLPQREVADSRWVPLPSDQPEG